jgi:glc operon protein GlcG
MRIRHLLAVTLLAAWPAAAAAGDVLFFSRNQVDAAFAKGMPLAENGLYKIHASRRDAPGVGEVHTTDTDILYVLSGTATLVTGGKLSSPREVAPNELRGETIVGGQEREIGPGDVIVVPNGTPHWFKAIRGPVTYYVVKATEGGSAR